MSLRESCSRNAPATRSGPIALTPPDPATIVRSGGRGDVGEQGAADREPREGSGGAFHGRRTGGGAASKRHQRGLERPRGAGPGEDPGAQRAGGGEARRDLRAV